MIVGYNFMWLGDDLFVCYYQVNVGVDYLLSKCIDFYMMVGYQYVNGFNGIGLVQVVIGLYNVDVGMNLQLFVIVGIWYWF